MIENVSEVMATNYIMPNCANMIDINMCADVVGKTLNEYMIPLGVVAIIALVGLLVTITLYMFERQEKNLQKDYIRRQGLLNKYEDWKRDRKLGD